MGAPAGPQVVVSVTAGEMEANYQGPYDEDVMYQRGQWVSEEEGLYACIAVSEGNVPSAAGSAFWRLIGAIPAEA